MGRLVESISHYTPQELIAMRVCKFFNDLLELDYDLVYQLFQGQFACNAEVTNDNYIVVAWENPPIVTLLGILQGLLGSSLRLVLTRDVEEIRGVPVYDATGTSGKIMGFSLMDYSDTSNPVRWIP